MENPHNKLINVAYGVLVVFGLVVCGPIAAFGFSHGHTIVVLIAACLISLINGIAAIIVRRYDSTGKVKRDLLIYFGIDWLLVGSAYTFVTMWANSRG